MVLDLAIRIGVCGRQQSILSTINHVVRVAARDRAYMTPLWGGTGGASCSVWGAPLQKHARTQLHQTLININTETCSAHTCSAMPHLDTFRVSIYYGLDLDVAS